MARFSGPQPGYKSGRNKGVMRAYKLQKRKEAEQRQKDYNKKQNSIDNDGPTVVK